MLTNIVFEVTISDEIRAQGLVHLGQSIAF
ncbi:MAG: hypothetical protein ACI9XK_000276 [Granulosicoccus sp.]|jgi:hypothetical protein